MAFDISSVKELIDEGNTAYERSEFRKAIGFYEQALAFAREIRNRRYEGVALGNLWKAYSDLGEIRKAIEFYKQALAFARKEENTQGEGRVLVNIGEAYSDLGEIGKAIKCYEKALKIARENKYWLIEGDALSNIGEAYSDFGETGKAIEFYKQALATFSKVVVTDRERKKKYKQSEGVVLGNLGEAYSDLGEIGKAIEYYEQALDIAREIEDRKDEGEWLLKLGEANMVFGDWNKSLQLFNDALKIFVKIESLAGQGETLSNIEELQIKSGEWEDARKNLKKSRTIYEILKEHNRTTPVGAIDYLLNLGELLILEDSYEEAFSRLEDALEVTSELESSPKKVKIFNKIGRAYLMEFEFNNSQKSLDRAKNFCKSALELAEKLQRPLDQEISLRNLGIVYSKHSQINESKNYFTQSLEIFQTLGARYELARTYLELAKMLAEDNELLEAEEKTKVCAFDAIRRNFNELEVRSYMLLGDIVWKQDSTHYGYYLSALKTAIFNPKIYTRTIFLLIDRMKRLEKNTTIAFIEELKKVNIEVYFGVFLTALASKIRGKDYSIEGFSKFQGKDYSIEGLPQELVEELNNFPIASK